MLFCYTGIFIGLFAGNYFIIPYRLSKVSNFGLLEHHYLLAAMRRPRMLILLGTVTAICCLVPLFVINRFPSMDAQPLEILLISLIFGLAAPSIGELVSPDDIDIAKAFTKTKEQHLSTRTKLVLRLISIYIIILEKSSISAALQELEFDAEDCWFGKGYWAPAQDLVDEAPQYSIPDNRVMRCRITLLYAKEKERLAKRFNSRPLLNHNSDHIAHFEALVAGFGRKRLRARLLDLSALPNSKPRQDGKRWAGLNERKTKAPELSKRKDKTRTPIRAHEDDSLVRIFLPTNS